MAGESSSTVLKEIATLFGGGALAAASDGRLLERFLQGPESAAEEAFTILVERHAPMVLRTCRQILGDPHEAEDASQATFLVLARQARSIRCWDSVAGWLHGVAGRIAIRAKVDAARRRLHEHRRSEAAPTYQNTQPARENWAELHEELDRLPEKFRLPIVLCHLEGLSYEQAANRLGCPVRTVQSRLSRGRERLRTRLTRRGLSPAGVLLFPTTTLRTSLDATAEGWRLSFAREAFRFTTDRSTRGSIPPKVIAQAEGALKTMIFTKFKTWAAAIALLGTFTCGLAVWGGTPFRDDPSEASPPASDQPKPPYRTTMADGTTIDVVGVSTFPSGPKSWWRPDGSPLDEDPGDLLLPRFDEHPDRQIRAILVRVTKHPRESTLKWLPMDIREYWGGGPTKNGKRVPELEVYVASFPKERKTCAVEIRLASGEWETNASNDGHGGTSFFKGPYKFYYGKARDYRGGTAIAVAQNIVGRDSRVVAIGRNGETYSPVSSSGAGGEVLSLLDVEFSAPPSQIRDYQVQSRPFERVEIQGIALHPKQPQDPSQKRGSEHQAERTQDTRIPSRSEFPNPGEETKDLKNHHIITLSRAYWATASDAPEFIREAMAKRVTQGDPGHLMVHGEEWFDDQPYQQYKRFFEHAGKKFLFKAEGEPEVHGAISKGSITHPSQNLHEVEIRIPPDEYAKMRPGVDYTVEPVNEVPDYLWKTQGTLTIKRPKLPD